MKVFEVQERFGIEQLRTAERGIPEPGAGDVRVRVEAVSLNYRDLDVVRGKYHMLPAPPFVPVSDGAGIVDAVGEGVTRVRVGDRVIGHFMPKRVASSVTAATDYWNLGVPGPGLLAEYVTLPQEAVVPAPAHLTADEASTLPIAALTAWNALFTVGGLTPGQTVLIQGTGGVAIFALQFARLAGARVIALSSSNAKLARAQSLGADGLINYRETPDWEVRVRELTGGEGVDQIVEIGGGDTLPRSVKAARFDGHIHVIGYLAGHTVQVQTLDILLGNVNIHGIRVGSREELEALNRAITLNQLHPVVDRVFPFEESADAFRYLESGSHFGKVVIRIA